MVGSVARNHYGNVPHGQIASPSPAAGTVVASGTRVDLALSIGPEPGTDPDPGGGTCAHACPGQRSGSAVQRAV